MGVDTMDFVRTVERWNHIKSLPISAFVGDFDQDDPLIEGFSEELDNLVRAAKDAQKKLIEATNILRKSKLAIADFLGHGLSWRANMDGATWDSERQTRESNGWYKLR